MKIFHIPLEVIIILDEFVYGNISRTSFWEKLKCFVEKSLILRIESCLRDNMSKSYLIWNFFFCMQLSLSWMSSYMEIFQELVLGKILVFLLKNHWFCVLSLACTITWVNLIWFEKYFIFHSQLSLSWKSSYMEIFQELVLGKNLVFCWKITDFFFFFFHSYMLLDVFI